MYTPGVRPPYEITLLLTLIHRTGPNISSFQILLVVGTSMMIVGGMKNPAPVPEMGTGVYIHMKSENEWKTNL